MERRQGEHLASRLGREWMNGWRLSTKCKLVITLMKYRRLFYYLDRSIDEKPLLAAC